MLEDILSDDNMNLAYNKVMQNKGTSGVDGMRTEQLLPWLLDHGASLRRSILDGTYSPAPVRHVEIPKDNGGRRTLGIPTAVDRLIQRAIAQVLMPLYETRFAEASYAYRPERGAEDAVLRCRRHLDEGRVWVVDMDIEKFFDTVCQARLLEVLFRDIPDRRVPLLICKYISAGAVRDGKFQKVTAGVPQGGPLSPLLANIMLNELDQELDRRNERFVRYADDLFIFCPSRAAACQALKHIAPCIEEGLFLSLNKGKTVVVHADRAKFLGYGFFRAQDGYRLRVHERSLEKMRAKVEELARRALYSDGFQRLRQYVTGWAAQYRLADVERFLRDCSGWMGSDLQALFVEAWGGRDEMRGDRHEQDALCHEGWVSEAQGQHACYPNEGWDFEFCPR